MLYPNSGNSTKLSASDYAQSDYIEKRRQKLSGSGGLNQSVGASSNLNPLTSPAVGTVSVQAQHANGHEQADLNNSQNMQDGAGINPKVGNVMYQRKNSRASKSRGNSNKTPNI